MTNIEPIRPVSRRRPTSTSAFGVGRREAHDSSSFYARFTPPRLSDDDNVTPTAGADTLWVGNARDMDRYGEVADNSVALVVTSPPYFAGKEYESVPRSGARPRRLPRLPGHAARRIRAMLREARARRAHRGERGQPGPQALPVAVTGRHRPPRAARLPPAGRDHLEEESGRRGILRLGHLPTAGQPGPSRRVRADHGGVERSVRPRPHPRPASTRGTAE